VCEHCGRVLEQVVHMIGSELSAQVQHAQQQVTEQDTLAVGCKNAQQRIVPVRGLEAIAGMARKARFATEW
jgi:hypothetical protein